MSFVGIKTVVEIWDTVSPPQLASIVQHEQQVIVTCWKLRPVEMISKIKNRFSSAVNEGQQGNVILPFFFFFVLCSPFFFKGKRAMHTTWYLTASQWHFNKIASSQFNVHLSVGSKCR